MKEQKYTYLIYDKYCDNYAAYPNIKTKDITVESLFESNYSYFENEDALLKINDYKKKEMINNYFLKIY